MSGQTVTGLLLFGAVVATVVAFLWCRPDSRRLGGALVSASWTACSIVAVNGLAGAFGWWHFPVEVDLAAIVAAWALIHGFVPALIDVETPLVTWVAALGAADFVVMPLVPQMVTLGDQWLAGEVVYLASGPLVGLWAARLTHRGELPAVRAALQAVVFGVMLVVGIPWLAAAITGVEITAGVPAPWVPATLVIGAIPGLVGLSAVAEFALAGRGTPLPYDPPQRLVRSGPYRYLANPMQTVAVLILSVAAIATWSWPLAIAAGVGALYAELLMSPSEAIELNERFPDAGSWLSAAPRWLPSLRPVAGDAATLFVDLGCGRCAEVASIIASRQPRDLTVADASDHSVALTRIRYEGSVSADGLPAVARAVEHISLLWALFGWVLRIPGVAWAAQSLADLFVEEPHSCSVGDPRLDPALLSDPVAVSAWVRTFA
jgi:protein-S-isoprenylcysteine O-methyltransferase Ste14